MIKDCDVAIIGAGVTGTSLAYLLSEYTTINNVVIIDKCNGIAKVNSNSKYNSQTLHCGDIETNYNLDQARKIQQSANLIKRYVQRQKNRDEIMYQSSKLLIGVGEQEINIIKQRYHDFKPHFPSINLYQKKDIEKIEPNVLKNRKDDIIALGSTTDYCGVDFGCLSRSFIANASNNKNIQLFLNAKLTHAKRNKNNQEYQLNIETENGKQKLNAKFIVFSTGAYSLTYAKKMGYGKEYGLLSVAGSFYFSKKALKGKVYTVQNDKLPFAAVHGDPDINVPSQTRFGPTALVLPQLERYNHRTYLDYFKVMGFDKHIFRALTKLLKDKHIRNYIFTNFAYEIPYIGKKLFLKEAQKIIPTLDVNNLNYAKGFGGLRPQIIDKNKEQLILGEAHIDTDEGLIFNITPSPGASNCLKNALRDANKICQHLKMNFLEEKFNDNFNSK